MLYIDIPFEQATEMVGGLSRSLDSNPGGEGERGENYNKFKTKTRMVQLGESLLTYDFCYKCFHKSVLGIYQNK